jgi:hypothetical protein
VLLRAVKATEKFFDPEGADSGRRCMANNERAGSQSPWRFEQKLSETKAEVMGKLRPVLISAVPDSERKRSASAGHPLKVFRFGKAIARGPPSSAASSRRSQTVFAFCAPA